MANKPVPPVVTTKHMVTVQLKATITFEVEVFRKWDASTLQAELERVVRGEGGFEDSLLEVINERMPFATNFICTGELVANRE